MDPLTPISGTDLDTVTLQALARARAGERSAFPVRIGSRGGVVTPHRDDEGTLDADDLAAQVYALAHDLPSADGRYTGGAFASGGTLYWVGAAPPAPELLD